MQWSVTQLHLSPLLLKEIRETEATAVALGSGTCAEKAEWE
jgi:hypothetical protein